jgi:hypothetical protein
MRTKGNVGHSKVIRKLEPIVQPTGNDQFPRATNVNSAALKQKLAVQNAYTHAPKCIMLQYILFTLCIYTAIKEINLTKTRIFDK